ncbi:hypothetical protein ACA910_006220 [Epithemia clementina (nom. ined.)]
MSSSPQHQQQQQQQSRIQYTSVSLPRAAVVGVENAASNIVHHPWKAEKIVTVTGCAASTTRSSVGVGTSCTPHKIDRFLTRSKRRKSGSWGSDSSTILTESTGQSSQSSAKSSSSPPSPPVPPVQRKSGVPHHQLHHQHHVSSTTTTVRAVPSLATNHSSQERDLRGTIGSVDIGSPRQVQTQKHQHHQQQKHHPIDVDSLEEYEPESSIPSRRPGPDRALSQLEISSSNHDDKHFPPRSPRRSPLPPNNTNTNTSNNSNANVNNNLKTPMRTRKIVIPPPPKKPGISVTASTRRAQHQQEQRSQLQQPDQRTQQQPYPTGPIDVDSMEAYTEDASVDSLAMMRIQEESDHSEDFSDGLSARKPAIATRQRTNSSSLETSFSNDDLSFHSNSVYDDEENHYHYYYYEEEEEVPLDAFMRLNNLEDLLAESDDEDDYFHVHAYLDKFPILDESEMERVLCGYSRGFEPPMDETVKIITQPNVKKVTHRRNTNSSSCSFEI